MTELTLTARNTAVKSEDGGDPSWQLADVFSDGITQNPASMAQDTFSVDGIYLVDGLGAKRYLPARTASGACVCSGDLAPVVLHAGDSVVLTTFFAALPAGIDTVSVSVPRFGTFDGTQITR